jgi:hypothetical protein
MREIVLQGIRSRMSVFVNSTNVRDQIRTHIWNFSIAITACGKTHREVILFASPLALNLASFHTNDMRQSLAGRRGSLGSISRLIEYFLAISAVSPWFYNIYFVFPAIRTYLTKSWDHELNS